MHSQHRSRAKVFFEVLCALSLAGSFAGAWDQTGSSALLASAGIMALFALYWSGGLFARRPAEVVAEPAVAPAEVFVREPEVPARVELLRPEEFFAREVDVPAAVEPVAFAPEPEVAAEPEPVAEAPKPKKRAPRKAKKAAAEPAPVVEQPEPVAVEVPVSTAAPVEQLFDPVPFVREPRMFGRKANGPRTLRAG